MGAAERNIKTGQGYVRFALIALGAVLALFFAALIVDHVDKKDEAKMNEVISTNTPCFSLDVLLKTDDEVFLAVRCGEDKTLRTADLALIGKFMESNSPLRCSITRAGRLVDCK